jgi:hypothetical protein
VENQAVSSRLGWATMPEIAVDMVVQGYDTGLILCIANVYDYLDNPDRFLGTVYALTILGVDHGYWARVGLSGH